MQKKKNLRLLTILSVLIVITAILYSMGDEKRGTNLSKEKFAVADTSQITRVEIMHQGKGTVISRENGRWMVNDKYLLDEGMRTVLISVLNRVRVQRQVAEVIQAEVNDSLRLNGYQVKVYGQSQLLMEYFAGGDKGANVSYFKKPEEETPYVVHLPGYESYVTGLFEITENDWRNRIVLATNWNVIDTLTLDYPQNPQSSFSIIFRNNQYQVPEVAKADTSVLYNFMDNISYIVADQYIDKGQYPQFDSLANTQPLAVLFVKEIGEKFAKQVQFYPPLPQKRMLLGKFDNQLILFDFNRIRSVLIRREALVKEK